MIMSQLLFEKAMPEHATEITPVLRQADVVEAVAARLDPYEAIHRSIVGALWAWTVRDNTGAIVAVFGLGYDRTVPGLGVPWMVGSDLVTKRGRDLLREAPIWLRKMHEHYPRLANFVHRDNARAIRFLKHLGFAMAPVPTSPNFIYFHRREHVH